MRFVISNKAGLKHVLGLVNGKFVLFTKVDQLIKINYEQWLGIIILKCNQTGGTV